MAWSSHSRKTTKWEMTGDAQSPAVLTAEIDPSMVEAGSEPDASDASELPEDMTEWTQEEIIAFHTLRSKRKRCCIGGCTTRSLPIARSYHLLPTRNKEIWARWVEVIRWSRNEPDWKPSGEGAAPLVCSRHFPDSNFMCYEASSRVCLLNDVVPVYYIDPPVGTDMDARFSKPLPVPPIPAARPKKKSKPKKIKLEDSEVKGESYHGQIFSSGSGGTVKFGNYSKQSIPLPMSDVDNLAYDIEEVNNYDGSVECMGIYSPQFTITREHLSNNNPLHQIRHSAPPSLIQYKKNRKVGPASRPPVLMRRNSATAQSSGVSKVLNLSANVNHFTKRDMLPKTKLSNPTAQYQINLTKCRLIVQTLENQLIIAKTRVAEQLDVPYDVVDSVWDMRDSLKHEF